jgi:hypothetical protein
MPTGREDGDVNGGILIYEGGPENVRAGYSNVAAESTRAEYLPWRCHRGRQ